MIYITGDVHGMPISMKRFNIKNFPEQKNMTKDDYVIIAGDFGWVWDNSKEEHYWLKWLDEKPWTTLWIDGNHESFDLLESYPIKEWNGGNVHIIRDSVIHLMRGQVFNLQGNKFFTFGGAASHDKEHRKVDISWWAREMPSTAEYEEGLSNLDKHGWSVDYVVTHTCSEDALRYLAEHHGNDFEVDVMHKYFEQVRANLDYKKWFFGHFHNNVNLPNNQVLIYQQMLRLL